MRKIVLSILLFICFTQVYAQTTLNGTLQNTDPAFTRPEEGAPPVIISNYSNIYYHVLPYDVSTTGIVTFITNSSWDNFLILYNQSGCNPLSPLSNALVANDDFSGPNAGFTYNFTSTGRYFLVICSFKNNITGAYSITATNGALLPLKLHSFTARKATDNSNIINWKSSEELNLLSFQVQRGNDPAKFIDLPAGSIPASNNSVGNSYSIIDNHPGPGNQYYRLKIEEKSGQLSYSPIAVVKKSRPVISNLTVYPNPANEYLHLEMKSLQNFPVAVTIINTVGNLMQSGHYHFNSQAVLSINIKNLPSGKYFLKTIIDKVETSVMFIKR